MHFHSHGVMREILTSFFYEQLVSNERTIQKPYCMKRVYQLKLVAQSDYGFHASYSRDIVQIECYFFFFNRFPTDDLSQIYWDH